VVVQELSTRSYLGCPKDSKKIPDAIEGKEAVCPKCGNLVKPVLLQWAMYLAGDVTDEIIVSFPPSITNRPTERMIIVAQGVLGENEEFVVWRWTLPSESPKAPAASDKPLSTYFKPSEGTPTPTSTSTSTPGATTPTQPSTQVLATSTQPTATPNSTFTPPSNPPQPTFSKVVSTLPSPPPGPVNELDSGVAEIGGGIGGW
jgi:hypothetical protein